jgi:hypothetical protein
MTLIRIPSEDRFWAKVDKSGDCWLWTAGKTPLGYGKFQVTLGRGEHPKQKHVAAHRFAYETVNGPIPDGLVIMHACDNPPCVNPAHLSAGTQGDNRLDCVVKGRGAAGATHGTRTKPERVNRGKRHYKATITVDVVRDIRRKYDNGARLVDIARQLGLSYNIVCGVAYRTSWRDVQ